MWKSQNDFAFLLDFGSRSENEFEFEMRSRNWGRGGEVAASTTNTLAPRVLVDEFNSFFPGRLYATASRRELHLYCFYTSVMV